jgi:hypothetical protein
MQKKKKIMSVMTTSGLKMGVVSAETSYQVHVKQCKIVT